MNITFVYPRFDKFLETYPELAEMPAIAATWAFRMPPSMASYPDQAASKRRLLAGY